MIKQYLLAYVKKNIKKSTLAYGRTIPVANLVSNVLFVSPIYFFFSEDVDVSCFLSKWVAKPFSALD